MAAQLIDLKSRVAHLIRELDSLRDTGQNALLSPQEHEAMAHAFDSPSGGGHHCSGSV